MILQDPNFDRIPRPKRAQGIPSSQIVDIEEIKKADKPDQ